MLTATLIAIFFIPLLFVQIERLARRRVPHAPASLATEDGAS
jgi:hypothetical protein